MMKKVILQWVLRFFAVIILMQTLYFKFSGAEESIYIFSTLGIEPYGRIGSGIAEAIVSILLVIPRTTWLGALGGIAVMSGAILSHLFVLGITVQNDGGLLFLLAVLVLLSCLALLYLDKEKFLNVLKLNKYVN
ncbi:DoxX family protein [Flavobacterium sp. Fl-77]|uniref:DoxX family protein n=2 Tax=Flavobacterium flavipigmentatum TaxID=2893884 RepID=A0AAJ2S8V0_9FLAO|nr:MULTISPECIES: DoxX family membrane protein [unclassified Flavobacterium]MDX6186006.1 DoxX family protein [Flavobacterium sp. Fl-77]UFH39181.1 DoxX family protein [Flavobacterium sp. F-70]